MLVAANDADMLNAIYKEINEKMGMDAAMSIHQMFKGQQICFPVRFLNPAKVQELILKEYDGTNKLHPVSRTILKKEKPGDICIVINTDAAKDLLVFQIFPIFIWTHFLQFPNVSFVVVIVHPIVNALNNFFNSRTIRNY